jgi:hypothetical protein
MTTPDVAEVFPPESYLVVQTAHITTFEVLDTPHNRALLNRARREPGFEMEIATIYGGTMSMLGVEVKSWTESTPAIRDRFMLREALDRKRMNEIAWAVDNPAPAEGTP